MEKAYICLIIFLGISLAVISFEILPIFTVLIIASILELIFGVKPVTDGSEIFVHIQGATKIISISPECSGLILMITCITLIFLLPKITLRNRIKSIALIPIIFSINIMRILLSMLIGMHFNKTYLILIVHDTIGQVLIVIMVIATMVLYLDHIKYFKEGEEK
jgi:exosortase/archaeosortase family protein